MAFTKKLDASSAPGMRSNLAAWNLEPGLNCRLWPFDARVAHVGIRVCGAVSSPLFPEVHPRKDG